MIIDTHTHIFSDKEYESYFKKSEGKISKALTIHYWLRQNEQTGREDVPYPLSDFLSFVKDKGNLFGVISIDIDKDIREQLRQIEHMLGTYKNIVALKLYPGYQYFYPSDERVNPVAEFCTKHKKPLIIHTGDVYDPDMHARLEYSHPIHIDTLASRYPHCTIVIAHTGFPYILETVNIVSAKANVHTEISATLVAFDSKEDEAALFNQYVLDLTRALAYFPDARQKIMFGTDYAGEHTYLNQVEPYITLVETVFSKAEQEHVFHTLAEKLFKIGSQ